MGAQGRGKPEEGPRESGARHREGSRASWEGKRGKADGPGTGHRSGASGEAGEERGADSVMSASDLLFDHGDY